MLNISYIPKKSSLRNLKNDFASFSSSLILHFTIILILVLVEDAFLELTKASIDNKATVVEFNTVEDENLFQPNFGDKNGPNALKNAVQNMEDEKTNESFSEKESAGDKLNKKINNYKQALAQHFANVFFQNEIDLGNIPRVEITFSIDKLGLIVRPKFNPEDLPVEIKRSLIEALRKASPLPVPLYDNSKKIYKIPVNNEKLKDYK